MTGGTGDRPWAISLPDAITLDRRAPDGRTWGGRMDVMTLHRLLLFFPSFSSCSASSPACCSSVQLTRVA